MKRYVVAIVVALTLLIGSVISASATDTRWRITGTDQSGNTTVLYCTGTSNPHACNSVYGYVYGDPRTVIGGLSRGKQAARGYTWVYVGPVSTTCEDNPDLLCVW